MSLPLSPTMVEQFFELEELKARQIWRDEMDSCMNKIFGQMKRKLMHLVESGGIETDDEVGDPTDREQQLDTNDIYPFTSTNSQDHQVNTLSPCTDDHFDDNNHQQNGQVNNVTDSDTQLDCDKHEIKEEFDDTDNQLELIPNQTQNADIPLTNALTTSNEIPNHYNLTGWEEENQPNLKHNQQVNPSDQFESPNSLLIGDESGFNPEILAQEEIEVENEMRVKIVMDRATQTNGQFEDWVKHEIKKEFADVEVVVGDDLRDQVGNIPQNAQSHQVNFHFIDDNSFHKTNSSLPNDQIELSDQAFDDNHQQNGQMNSETDNDTQQDWDEHEIEEEGVDGQIMYIEEEDENDYESDQEENFGDENTEIDNEDKIHEHDGQYRLLENPIDTTPPPHLGSSQVIRQSARIEQLRMKRKYTEEEPNEVNNHVNHENPEENEEEEEEVTSRSVKRSRQSSPTTSNSSTKQKQIITVTLQCPQCLDMFVEEEFTKHLWNGHSIRRYRCLVKDCRQSFDNQNLLGEHLTQSHQSTTQWNCDKCDHHYPAYKLLSQHNTEYHHLGHFQCSFPACTFTGEHRKKVYDHYRHQHKIHLTKCQHPGCNYKTAYSSHLKTHQRAHLGIKPFRCKWSLCDYASTQKSKTIRHIRTMHFTHNSSPNATQLGDPKDYLEVVRELLL